MRVILLGPPGSGKGTQASFLARELGVPHIATGDILRKAVEEGREVGRKAKEYMDRGLLVPDDIVIEIVKERIKGEEGFILDGFPRNIKQAEALGDVDVVLYIKVSEEELIKRLSGRLICKRCQAPYNKYYNPPKKEGVCDRCGGELYQREDDREEVVRERIKVYMEETSPLIDYYEKRGKLVEINGEGSVEEVWGEIKKRLGL